MEKSATTEPGANIQIGNAGLVLFNPFLETYFNRTGLMEQHAFKNEDSRLRAVLLLQYLANGSTTCKEQDLPLNKLLCGLELNHTVPASFTPTDTETAITLELQQVIIERWDKMKNTSVQGLQTSFIMREAVLIFRDNSPTLVVEQRGYDVLLQTLPWSFNIIKTAWMQQVLTVEWI